MVSKWTQPTPVGTALDTDARTHTRARARARAATTNRIHIHIRAVIALRYNGRDYHGKHTLACVRAVRACVRACMWRHASSCVVSLLARSRAHVSYVRSVSSSSSLSSLLSSSSLHGNTHVRHEIRVHAGCVSPRLIVDLCGIGPRLHGNTATRR